MVYNRWTELPFQIKDNQNNCRIGVAEAVRTAAGQRIRLSTAAGHTLRWRDYNPDGSDLTNDPSSTQERDTGIYTAQRNIVGVTDASGLGSPGSLVVEDSIGTVYRTRLDYTGKPDGVLLKLDVPDLPTGGVPAARW